MCYKPSKIIIVIIKWFINTLSHQHGEFVMAYAVGKANSKYRRSINIVIERNHFSDQVLRIHYYEYKYYE
jgi:hypothetical protein